MKKRSDGRYCTTVTVNGTKRTVYGRTVSELESAVRDLSKQTKKTKPNGSVLVRDVAMRWLDYVDAKGIAFKTKQSYHSTYYKYIDPRIGEIPVSELTPNDVKLLYAECESLGISQGTANYIKNALCQLLDYAVDDLLITSNPALKRKIRGKKGHPKEPLTPEQQQTVLEQAQTLETLPVLAAVMLLCGLRRGEVLALTIDDIDFERNEVRINKALEFKDNIGTVKPPKSSAGDRAVPIPSLLVPVLRKYIPHCTERILFPKQTGGYYSATAIKKAWDKYLSASGLPKLGMHQYRHTFCTNLVASGVNVKVAQTWMGHATASITMQVYTHRDRKTEESSFALYDSALRGVELSKKLSASHLLDSDFYTKTKEPPELQAVQNGAPSGTRTRDTLIKSGNRTIRTPLDDLIDEFLE